MCEKPDAAGRVARALDDDSDPRRIDTNGVPVYESRHGRETIFTCSALGHLYAVDSKTHASRRFYPIWDFLWKPKSLVDRKSARLAKWISTIGKIAQNADRFINACDYDVEGSLIGYTVLRYACNNSHEDALRMKFSTMTEKELQTAYKTLAPRLDFSQAAAGQCRHELDWIYGINLSRLLTESALKQNRGYSTLSTGRVQGPTLKFVVLREQEIQSFAPTPFWTIKATIEHRGANYQIEYQEEKIPSLTEASQIVNECKNALLEVSQIDSRTIEQPPPTPFDLSTLQAEAYRHFGYTPARTLSVAERLYLDALISYPRTSSQKLPPDIGYREILRGLASTSEYKLLASRLAGQTIVRPREGPKQDPAHPAIYPTGEIPKCALHTQESRLLDMIIRRFMSTFAEPSLRQITTLRLTKDEHVFFLKGSHLERQGWFEFYRPYASEEFQELPDLKNDAKITIKTIESPEKFTEPPPRYNPSSLLRRMEDTDIGTKATRADIIETLYRRGYIKETRMLATPLAQKIISILEKYCPIITDFDFTARLEEKMEEIQNGHATRQQVVASALEHLRPVMLSLISMEEAVGGQLAEVVVAQKMSETTLSSPCPSCAAQLRIIRSRKSGKRFIGCTGYQRGCRFTLPLPQFGALTLTSRTCETCHFQLISVKSRVRRPSISCPRCYASKSNKKSSDDKHERPGHRHPMVRALT